MNIIYKGFSSHNFATLGGTFSMTGIDLVNMNILSHIYTEKRDRVMMPTFGTNIGSYAHEMLTEELVENIKDDLTSVVNADPRVEKIRLVITPYYDSNSLVATLTLRYIELNVVDDLNFVINIDTGN
jgi:phage baseplate assembly protein W